MANGVQNLIDHTLVQIGVLDQGETPSSSDRTHALNLLNRMIGSWSAAGVPVFKLSREEIATSGATTYNMVTRALKITAAACSDDGVSQPVEIVNAEKYAAVSRDRTRTGKFIQVLLYDAAYATGTVRVWPAATGSTLELFYLAPLSAAYALGDDFSLPPGYEWAFEMALGEALASSYGVPLPPQYVSGTAEAKQNIARLNAEVLGVSAPAAAPAPAAQ